MPNPYFSFKQFTIFHDQCAMKVGTDGVVLGAWAGRKSDSSFPHILDIGSGSGLITLMMAQRFSEAQVYGVEIEEMCFIQSMNNISESPFSDRVHMTNSSIQEYNSDQTFDLIVSNPPFFTNGSLIDDETRNIARNNEYLSLSDLWTSVIRLSNLNSIFAVILPIDNGKEMIDLGIKQNWNVIRMCEVSGSPSSKPKRLLLEFSQHIQEPIKESLILESERGVYTDEYAELTKDFYLNL